MKNSQYFVGGSNKTMIIPLTLCGYEMIIATSALHTSVTIHLISNAHLWNNNCSFLKTESLDNAILELWLASPSWYMSHYTMLSKYMYGNCMRQLKIKSKRKLVIFTNKVRKNSQYFGGVFNDTIIIIPLALVGYEMIIANSYPTRAHGIIVK